MSLPGLPPTVISRTIVVNDLEVFILEALPPGTDPSSTSKPPLVVLLHGFPELAYSWRKVISPLAEKGYAVVAPDQRGYGQTRERGREGRKVKYEDPLTPFHLINLANDIAALVGVLGYTSVACVVGHDFGSPVAAHCAHGRPDLFRSVVMMSAPWTGRSPLAELKLKAVDGKSAAAQFVALLASFEPPRKHYTLYFSTPQADADLTYPPEGLHSFLRQYHHMKSGDWKKNEAAGPLDVQSKGIHVMAELPNYYIMPLNHTMPDCIAAEAPPAEEIPKTWLTDEELAFYVFQFEETGFQGGLNWYRAQFDPSAQQGVKGGDLGWKPIEVPAMFIAGRQDWGVWQFPGAVETMRSKETCNEMKEEDFVLVDGAGHWVQQERPEIVVDNLVRFLKNARIQSGGGGEFDE